MAGEMSENTKLKNDLDKRANYHRAGRWLEEPKTEHKIVLQAVEIANKAYGRAVNLNEVSEALLPKEVKLLESTYSESVNSVLCKILNLLCKRQKINLLYRVGRRKFYGVTGFQEKRNVNLSKAS
jgi:ribosomal protein L7Ae-like RNA K-turn-binding protein